MKRIVYLTPTGGYSAAEQSRREALLRQYLPADCTLEMDTLPRAPEFFDRPDDFDDMVRKAGEAIAAYGEGVAAVIAGGAIDPGLPDIRARAHVPVVGAGEASLFVAAILRRPLSVVTTDAGGVAVAREFVRRTATKPEVVSVRSMDVPVRQIMADPDAGKAALRREARLAVQHDGAGAVYLGAMTLGTLGLDEDLRRELEVPVLNPLPIAVAAAVAVARASA